MLNYALIFLVISLIAGVLGFGGIAGDAAWIAKVLFVCFSGLLHRLDDPEQTLTKEFDAGSILSPQNHDHISAYS